MKRTVLLLAVCALMVTAASAQEVKVKRGKATMTEEQYNALKAKADAYEVEKKALAGDEKCQLLVNAFTYQVSMEISRLAAVVNGKVDAIILTGGIAYSKPWMAMIEERVGWIAPVKIYKGENEMLALAICGKEVLDGVEVKEYK